MASSRNFDYRRNFPSAAQGNRSGGAKLRSRISQPWFHHFTKVHDVLYPHNGSYFLQKGIQVCLDNEERNFTWTKIGTDYKCPFFWDSKESERMLEIVKINFASFCWEAKSSESRKSCPNSNPDVRNRSPPGQKTRRKKSLTYFSRSSILDKL